MKNDEIVKILCDPFIYISIILLVILLVICIYSLKDLDNF